MTESINIKNMSDGDIYCGRGSGDKNDPRKCLPEDKGYFGNPIKVGSKCVVCSEVHSNGETLACFKKYLIERLSSDQVFKDEFYKLKGKRLACFCKPKAYHTDIMIEILEER